MNFLEKLENNNIRSDDLYSGEQIQRYLGGDLSNKTCYSNLMNRRKELSSIIKGIDKLLNILTYCPKQVNNE